MQRESRLGRALWLVLLALIGGFVLVDFVRSPFSMPSGAAAGQPAAVRILAPDGEAGDEAEPVLEAAAVRLRAGGHPASVRTTHGGVAAGLVSFFSSEEGGQDRLMAITSTTIADLAHDRRETLVPGAAEEAALAWALLRRSRPIATLAEAPLELAVESSSAFRTGADLLASMTAAPAHQLFGIDDDIYSRDQLAALVMGAGVDGEVRFSTYQSANAATQAVKAGAARTILAGRPTLRPAIRAGELRGLGWPLHGAPPRVWVALVAPPGIGTKDLRKLRRWVDRLLDEPQYLRHLVVEGRTAPSRGTRALSRRLRRTASADRLERLARKVENG